MLKAIIFDFGGVFNKDDIQKFWQENQAKFGIDITEANKLVSSIWPEARIGKIDSNIFWEELGKYTKVGADNFKKCFLEFGGFNDELYQYIKQTLQGKYKLAILSNQIKSWLEPIMEAQKFREVFDVIVTSYDTGLAKPDPKIFEHTLRGLGVKAEECLYIEDRAKNLETAKALGIATIQFKNYNQLIKDLDNFLK